ncbi:MAG TPA: helix-turn-helix domain-containing protein [Solirubrobacteraceae bacterium]|nr:helix-turn-helix domain-containing protein [Solirubrobacteraceae bacterium]
MGLRVRRLELGLTQSQLAAHAGVSRQLVAAAEAGRNTPAVDAALALSRALGATVEELFGSQRPERLVGALGTRPPDGVPLRVGRVGDQLVAAELVDHGVAGAGWAAPDGVLADGTLHLFDGAAPAGVVIAGCDPALGVAEAMLAGLGPRSLLAISAPTGAALKALRAGTVHAAVVHDRWGRLPKPPVAVARWRLASWQVGVGVASRRRLGSLESVLAGRVVQREPAASSQRAFERSGGRAGHGPVASGHLEAARVGALLGLSAVTTEGAARAFGLRFLPLEEHAVEVWVAERWLGHPGVEALAELLGRPAFTDRVAQFGGYDLTGCGTQIP